MTRSAKELGVLEPAVVIHGEDGRYLLLFGQRRLAAAIASERPLPAVVAADVDETGRIARQLARNLHARTSPPQRRRARTPSWPCWP